MRRAAEAGWLQRLCWREGLWTAPRLWTAAHREAGTARVAAMWAPDHSRLDSCPSNGCGQAGAGWSGHLTTPPTAPAVDEKTTEMQSSDLPYQMEVGEAGDDLLKQGDDNRQK